MIKAFEEHKQVRIEYLEFRASFHLKLVTESDTYIEKIEHWRMFIFYNTLLIKEKYNEDWLLTND